MTQTEEQNIAAGSPEKTSGINDRRRKKGGRREEGGDSGNWRKRSRSTILAVGIYAKKKEFIY